jgi:hypothetical protein
MPPLKRAATVRLPSPPPLKTLTPAPTAPAMVVARNSVRSIRFRIGGATITYYDGNEPNSLLQRVAERVWSDDTTLELPPRVVVETDGSSIFVLEGPDGVDHASAFETISAMLLGNPNGRYQVPTRSRMDDMKTWASYLGLDGAAARIADMCTLPPESGVLYVQHGDYEGMRIIFVQIQAQAGIRAYGGVMIRDGRGDGTPIVKSQKFLAREHDDGFGLILGNGDVLRMVGTLSPCRSTLEIIETGAARAPDRLVGGRGDMIDVHVSLPL